jgi:lipopolysaccharide heptosyltransferase I
MSWKWIDKNKTGLPGETVDYRKILIIRLSAAGDVIRTLPAVKALREHEPSSHITWVVEELSKTLLESQPEIDEVMVFPRKRWTGGMRSPLRIWGTMGEVRRFIKQLRNRKFDIVFDFHGGLKSGLISYLTRAPKRIGFDRKWSKEWNFLFSNVRVKLPPEKIKKLNRFEQNLALLRGMGLEVKEVKIGLSIPSGDQEVVGLFFKNLATPVKRPLVAIHPGTSQKTRYKRWMLDRYAQLSDRLVRELGATVLFSWGPDELDWVKAIQKEMKERSITGPQTESLTRLGEVFRHCDLYVGGDTGPMHVASMMGIPVVAIFGPTLPEVHAPFGRHRMVRKDVGCSPCRNQRSCEALTCLKAVTVEDVFEAVEDLLRG